MPHMSSEVLWSWYAPLPLVCFSKRTQCGDVCFFVFVYFGISYSCTLIPYLALTRKGKEIPFELELINMRQCLIENQEKNNHGMCCRLAATRKKLYQPPITIVLLA